MTNAAMNLKSKPKEEFLLLMESKQCRDKHDRETKQQQKREIVQGNRGEVFNFCCGMCAKIAFQSSVVAVYRGSLFLVLDPRFTQQIRMKPHPKPKKLGQDTTIIAKMFCEKCEHDWGSLARVQNSYYPSIKIAQFSLVSARTGSKGRTYRKWKNAPFEVKNLPDLPPEAAVKVPTDLLKKLKIL